MKRDKAGKSGLDIGRQRLSVEKSVKRPGAGRDPQGARAGASRQRGPVSPAIGVSARTLEAVQRCGRRTLTSVSKAPAGPVRPDFSRPDRRKSRQTVAFSPYIEGAARAL